MAPPAESKSKIVNPERIIRLIEKICSVNMAAILRPRENPSLSIRASFRKIINRNGNSEGFLVLNNISTKGMEKLAVGTVIISEIVGLSTKVSFMTRVMAHVEGGIAVIIPRELISVERRQAARCVTRPNMMGFLKLSKWGPDNSDLASPPVFDLYRSVAGWMSLGDISIGGCCVKVRFPSLLAIAESGLNDEFAELYLPLQKPMRVCVEARWQKRIKEKVSNADRQFLEFRVGLLFINPTPELQVAVKSYIKQLSVADAI